MAESFIVAFIKLGRRPVDSLLPDRARLNDPVNGLINILNGVNSGTHEGLVAYSWMDDAGTEPEGTIAVAAANVTSGDTVTFTFLDADIVLTAGTDFAVDTSDNSAQAQLLRDAINDNEFLNKFLVATESAGDVTVTGRIPGNFLENVTMATSDATAFSLTAIGTVTAGVDGDATYFGRGVNNL